MPPPESLNTNEGIGEMSAEAMPRLDASAPYNGMYANEAEFKAAEAVYKIDLNTTSFQQETVYPVATRENVSIAHETIETSTIPVQSPENEDVIDIEAREIFVDPDSLDDTEDIAELIANNDELTVGTEKLALTPKLKSVAEGVLSSLDMLLGSEPELPPEIDWRHYIMAEPDYDASYDYILLHKLLNAHYKRKRAKLGAGKLLESMRATSASAEGAAPPEQPPDGETAPSPQNPEVEGDILKIEMNQPVVNTETPKLEYEGAAPALTYESGTVEASQDQSGQNQTVQQ